MNTRPSDLALVAGCKACLHVKWAWGLDANGLCDSCRARAKGAGDIVQLVPAGKVTVTKGEPKGRGKS